MNSNCESCNDTTKMYLILEGLLLENPISKTMNRVISSFENRINKMKKVLKTFFSDDFNKMIMATVGYMAFSVFIMITAYALIVY